MAALLHIILDIFNPLESRGNYSATSNNMKLVHWPLMGGRLHLGQRGGDWAYCCIIVRCSAVLMCDKGLTSDDVVVSLTAAISIDATIAASDATIVNTSTTVSSLLERLSVEKLHQQTISMRH